MCFTNDYGEIEDNFKTIASFWNTYLKLDNEIKSYDVAVMMMLLKIAKISSEHQKLDNWINLARYAACGCECQIKGE